MTKRQEKIDSLIRELASEFILKKIKLKNTLITVTRAKISEDIKKLKIFITVYTEKSEARALKELNKNIGEWQKFLAKEFKAKFLPRSEFLIDEGEKNRQKVEELLKN